MVPSRLFCQPRRRFPKASRMAPLASSSLTGSSMFHFQLAPSGMFRISSVFGLSNTPLQYSSSPSGLERVWLGTVLHDPSRMEWAASFCLSLNSFWIVAYWALLLSLLVVNRWQWFLPRPRLPAIREEVFHQEVDFACHCFWTHFLSKHGTSSS